MSGYFCIAMLEDPPYNMIIGTTADDPEDWLESLPLPSHLLCYEYFDEEYKALQLCIQELKVQDIKVKAGKAFSAKPYEVITAFLEVRDNIYGDSSDSINDEAEEKENEAERIYDEALEFYKYDDKKYFALLKKAASLGYPAAMSDLAHFYYWDEECKKTKLALEWAYKAVKYDICEFELITKCLLELGLNSEAEKAWSDFFVKFLSLKQKDDRHLVVLGEYAVQVVSEKIRPNHPAKINEYLIRRAKESIIDSGSAKFSNESWKKAVYWMASLDDKNTQNSQSQNIPSGKNKSKSEADEYFELAEKYFDGNGVELDREKAKEFYGKAAEIGHAEAQYTLGVMCENEPYINEVGKLENYKKAKEWFKKASENGHVKAQSELVFLAANKNEANSFYTKIQNAAKNGNVEAQYELGSMYQYESYIYGQGIFLEKNDELSKYWYRKASEQYLEAAQRGSSDAQFKLANMYSSGQGVKENYKQAANWWKKAAEQGHRDSQHWLGWCFEYGNGIQQNDAKAIDWYTKCAKQGYSFVQNKLAVKYKLGKGVARDALQATFWFNEAAKRDCKEAQIYLADLYFNGEGIEKDEGVAKYWLQKAAMGSRHLCDPDRALDHCKLNLSAITLYFWAEFYVDGNVFEQNIDKAFFWFSEAANRGCSTAQCRLASMYLNGTHVDQSDQKAFVWFKKAAEQGDASGQYNLAVMCFKGRGINSDKELAIFWCKKAAMQGHQGAQEALMKIGVDWT